MDQPSWCIIQLASWAGDEVDSNYIFHINTIQFLNCVYYIESLKTWIFTALAALQDAKILTISQSNK